MPVRYNALHLYGTCPRKANDIIPDMECMLMLFSPLLHTPLPPPGYSGFIKTVLYNNLDPINLIVFGYTQPYV